MANEFLNAVDLRASISELPKFEVKAIVTNFDGKGMEHVGEENTAV